MKQIFKAELGRAMHGRGMFLSLLIGSVLAGAHTIQYIVPAYQANLTRFYEDFPILSPNSSVESWMAGNSLNLEGFIFFLILPILACLPFGTSYYNDCNSGFIKNIYMRTARKEYLVAKYLSAFLAGGVAVVVPLVLNLACSLILLPNLLPISSMGQNGICPLMLFYRIFFSYPIVYTAIFILLDFLMAGIWACIGLVASFLSDYKIIILICPFFVQLIIHVVCTITNKSEYSSVYWEQSGFGIVEWWIPIIYIAIGLVFTFYIFTKKGEKEDVF